MWISGGSHDVTDNIIHLVLAKIPDAEGRVAAGTTRDISLFIVPAVLPDGQANDVATAGLNHKMGYRALPNCALNFGEGWATPGGSAGAIGWRVGEVGQGLQQMFQMMNEARVTVGLSGAMLAVRGYQMSLDYARERRQGRVVGTRTAEQAPIISHADVRRMLLMQKAISQGALGLVLYSARLLDLEQFADTAAEREEAAALLALLTPATKTWPSEWAQVSLHHALQIHGGAGYTRDFEIELLYRDARLNPIHEGTTGIQGQDLVGRAAARWRRGLRSARRPHPRDARRCRCRFGTGGCRRAGRCGAGAVRGGARSVAGRAGRGCGARPRHAGATRLRPSGGGLAVAGPSVARRAVARHGKGRRASCAGGIRAARYFAESELPQVAVWLAPVIAGSDLVASAPADEF